MEQKMEEQETQPVLQVEKKDPNTCYRLYGRKGSHIWQWKSPESQVRVCSACGQEETIIGLNSHPRGVTA